MGWKQVFEGIKVVDFTWAAVGPLTMSQLALHGATVVKVETHRRPCISRMAAPFKDNITSINHAPVFATHNPNKYSISVDLNMPKGQEIAKKLAMWADIFGNSFTPGVMSKWGLDYESIKKIKPDIIYFSTSQQGQWGPHCKFAGFGFQASPLAGYSWLVGWPDREPSMIYGTYTDYIAPWYAVATLVAALLYRRKTGKGVCIDQSQFESADTLLAPAILDYTVNGRIANRVGNRHPYAAPHGAYRCQGQDRWVAIAVFSHEEWESFCKVIGEPEWTRDPKFSTLMGRKENEDELDRLVEKVTINYTPEEMMMMMQAKGVPAGVVQSCQDMFEDPQLKHRQAWPVLHHPVIGEHAYRAPACKLSKTPYQYTRPGPCLGEHNEHVFKKILGLSDDEIADLLVEGVITTDADLPEISSSV